MTNIRIQYQAAVEDAIRDVKRMDSAIEGSGSSTKRAGLSFTEMNSAVNLAGTYFNTLKGAVESVINPTIALAAQQRDLARNTGATIEQSGLLIQVADDLKVDYGTLTQSIKAMVKQGLVPNIETLGALSDEYRTIEDPVKRTEFAIKNFGRAGLEMTKILEAGSEGLKELEGSAISAGLVMDEQGVQAARDYEIAMDGLNDTVEGLKIQIGTALVPVLSDAAEGMTNLINVGKALSIVIREKTGVIDHDTAVMEANRLAGVDLGRGTTDLGDRTSDMGLRMLAAAGNADGLRASTEGLTEAHRVQLTATDLLSIGMRKYSDELLFNKASANLDAEAALALGIELGVVDTRALLAAQAIEALQSKYDVNRDGAISAGEATSGYSAAVAALKANIDALESKTVTITTVHQDLYPSGPGPGQSPVPLQHGGSFIVPPGFPNDSFRVGLTSGERVTVTPAAQTFHIDARGASMTATMIEAVMRRVLAEGGRRADILRRTT